MTETRHIGPAAPRTAEAGTAAPGTCDVPPLPAGLLANYRAVELLGAGAMGVVYRATHLGLNRPVAIKLPTLTDAEHVERFVREGRLLSGLGHPNLVRVYDAGEAGGRPYLVLEFVCGVTLTALAAGRPLAPTLAVALVGQLLDGLAHAHAAGILHRDVKSDNALVTVDGVLKLADFGLARSRFEPGKTQVGMIMGTPAYMSPEQALGLTVDARTDLYSAAVVLFELLAGHLPFVSEDPMDLLRMQVKETPPSLSRVSPAVPGALAQVVARGLAKAPEERFASAVEFSTHLRKAIGEPALERAGTRLAALVGRVSAGTQVVAGTTFLREAYPQEGPARTVSGATAPTRSRPVRPPATSGRTSDRTVRASADQESTVLRTAAGRPGQRMLLGLTLALLVLVAAGATWRASRASLARTAVAEPDLPVRAHMAPVTTPGPSTGALLIVSRPSGASILGHDGVDTGKRTPATIADLAPGIQSFTLDLSGYASTPISTAAIAGESRTVEVAFTLRKLSRNTSHFEEFRNIEDDSVLIAIPRGSFHMGADDLGPNEKPVHRVTLSPYYIGKFEVTWKQYRSFCNKTGHHLPPLPLSPQAIDDNYPVVNVDWADAEAYCTWAGLRLPTEAEWEYAARGHSGRKYPWGDAPPSNLLATFGRSPLEAFTTTPVGTYPSGASPFGALDMAGNALEWCHDFIGAYPSGAVTDPRGPDHGRGHYLRGGSWGEEADALDSAKRSVYDLKGSIDAYGFRVAR